MDEASGQTAATPVAAGYHIRLDNFEGPLDLLLHLIKEARIEIWEISVAKITAQYLDYLRRMEELNVEIAGEFLVMAATLMRIKSKGLLPRPPVSDADDDQPQSEEELIQRLLNYRTFKEAAAALAVRREQAGPRFARRFQPGLPADYEFPLQEIDLYILVRTLHEIEQRRQTEQAAIHQVRLDSVRLEDQVTFLLLRLEALGGRLAFHQLFQSGSRGVEIAVTLLAALELARQQVVQLLQDETFGDLWVCARRFAEESASWQEPAADEASALPEAVSEAVSATLSPGRVAWGPQA
ncbi:MAG: segregation/condensation protein A [Candidatus Eisenbacteria bacterium]|nr:segregation/condensation protein A [Candidatus Eisenbacteria bacterium]